MKEARAILWRELRTISLTACLLPGVEHKFPLLLASDLISVYRELSPTRTHSRVVLDSTAVIESGANTFKANLTSDTKLVRFSCVIVVVMIVLLDQRQNTNQLILPLETVS